MNIPVPFLKHPVGAGDAVKSATQAVGVKPCGGCQKRAHALNRAVTFVPASAGATMLPPAKLGAPYEIVLPGVVVGGSIPPGLRVDPVSKRLLGVPASKGYYQMIIGAEQFAVEVRN